MTESKKVVFKKASNPFYNAGIIGFLRNGKRFLKEHSDDFPEIRFGELEGNELWVEYTDDERFFSFLEEAYYYMGKIYYDTVTDKQQSNPQNIYFMVDGADLSFQLFPKIKTYGLSELFTNNAQGVTRLEENGTTFEALQKENPVLSEKIEEVFRETGIKLLKKLYFNEPYTKISRLTIQSKHLASGELICPVTGEGFKHLVPAQNISPFVSGANNFNSHFSTSDKKVSWKALYIIRFAPAVCFYSYQDNYETLIGHLLDAGNLKALEEAYSTSLYLPKEVLASNNQSYRINFDLGSFSYPKKDGDNFNITIGSDASWPAELTFALLHRFYNLYFRDKITEETMEMDLFSDEAIEKIPLSLITFQASKFGPTLRPNLYKEYDHLIFIFRFLYQLESNQAGYSIQFKDVWSGLKFSNARINAAKKRDNSRGKKLERQARAEILDAILKRESILHLFEDFYFEVYNALSDGMPPEYRNYKMLLHFFKLYQKHVPMSLSTELQENAINLGVSIGQGIIRFDNPDNEKSDAKTNVKIGRKYVIDLRNARTLEQFLQAIERIMFKYQINVKKDLLLGMTEENFLLIKQFAVIGALNQINPAISKNS